MHYVQGKDRNQLQIMRSLDECVGENNVVRVIDAFVDNLDVKALGFANSSLKNEGRPPYSPKDMLKLYIYGMENGITSSRKLEKECSRNMELMWLVSEIQPENKTICTFRKHNAKPLKEMFKSFCRMLKGWNMIDGKVMAIDGTKIRANNSKRNNYSLKKLERSLKYIDEKIAKYMTEIEQNDIDESSQKQFTKEQIQKKIIELNSRKAEYCGYKERIESGEATEISTTDPDARLMSVNNNGVEVSYNVQSVVDSTNKLIAGMDITSCAADAGQLGEVMPKVKAELELESITVLADKGYYKTDDFKTCEDNNITTVVAKQNEPKLKDGIAFSKKEFKYDEENDIYVCPAGNVLTSLKADEKGFKHYKNYKACTNCPHRAKCTTGTRKEVCRHAHASSAERNDKRLSENQVLYKQRQMLVEHPFGTIKRTMGIRQFATRGKESVAAEVALIFLCYNLKRLVNIFGIAPLIAKIQGKY